VEMASLCPRCLTALSPGKSACPQCGSELGATGKVSSGSSDSPPVRAQLRPDQPLSFPETQAPEAFTPRVIPKPDARGLRDQDSDGQVWISRASSLPRGAHFPTIERLPDPSASTEDPPPADHDPAGPDIASPASLLGPSSRSATPSATPSTNPATESAAAPDNSLGSIGHPSRTQTMTLLRAAPELSSDPESSPDLAPPPPPAITADEQAADRYPDPPHSNASKKRSRRLRFLPFVAIILVVAVVVAVVVSHGGAAPSRSAGAYTTVGDKTHTKAAPAHLIHQVAPKAPVLSTPTMSVPLHTPADDPRPEITIRVGNDAPINVILDTGSVGLRVFSDLVPTGTGKGIDVTSAQDEIEYVDGTQFSGSVSDALIHIGSLTTTRVVPFELVQSVTCDPTIPECPASSGSSGFQNDGVDGIMGIGLSGAYTGDPITNPLLALPAPYQDSWSIAMSGNGATLPASGALVLGAHDPGNAGAEFALQEQGASALGSPTWNDQFNLCWNVGGLSSCEMSVFDSGSDLTVLSGTNFANTSTVDPGEISVLTSGTNVQVTQQVDGNPLWSFNAGSGTMGTVLVEPNGIDYVNSGVQAFYSFKVTYDELHGEIFLS